MYVCTYVAVMLGNVEYAAGVQHVGSSMRFLASRFLAGCSSFIHYKDGGRFSTLKIDGQVCNAFRACRARAATCGAEQ